jgi:hypothetical protein
VGALLPDIDDNFAAPVDERDIVKAPFARMPTRAEIARITLRAAVAEPGRSHCRISPGAVSSGAWLISSMGAQELRGRGRGDFSSCDLLHAGCQPNRCAIIPVSRLALDGSKTHSDDPDQPTSAARNLVRRLASQFTFEMAGSTSTGRAVILPPTS